MASYFQMDGMASKALKGAAVGAGVCFAWWVGKQLMPSTPQKPFETINAVANEALCMDPEVRGLCARLEAYKYMDERQFTNLLVAWAQIISITVRLARKEREVHVSIPRTVAGYGSTVIEAVRMLRARVAERNSKMLHDFDELAADFQRKVNEYNFNTIKTVEYEMSK